MKQKIDNPEEIVEDAHKIRSKPLLNKIYTSWYTLLRNELAESTKVVELGSGGGFIKDYISNAVTSDVVKSTGIDKVFFAEKMPFKDNSISAFVMINVFHHVKDPRKALQEMERCLKINGVVIMIEPYNSLFGRFIYQHFHHEVFDPKVKKWKVNGKGRMSDANGAIPWVIFVRDKKEFDRKFPNIKLINFKPFMPFSYLLSGGLSHSQLIPNFLINTLLTVENLLPFQNHIGMFSLIKLKKVK